MSQPICQECQRNGIIEPSKVTDHIKPIELGGDPWNPENLQALCISCHNKKSRKEQETRKQK